MSEKPSETLKRVQSLARLGRIAISSHGYDQLIADDLTAAEAISGLADAVVVKDYPEYSKGPCVLVRQHDGRGAPIHAVWGIPKGRQEPAVLVTAYRPNPALWDNDFLERRQP